MEESETGDDEETAAQAVAPVAQAAEPEVATPEPKDATPAPQADAQGFVDYGGLSIAGGTAGTDYALESVNYPRIGRGNNEGDQTQNGRDIVLASHNPSEDLSMLVIKHDGSYVIKNTAGSDTAVATGIRVAPGVKADIVFAGVNISASLPMDIVTNSTLSGNLTAEVNGSDVADPTTVHLTLADGTTNKLLSKYFTEIEQSNFVKQYPGLRCGEGSVLTIDDAVRNVDTSGNPITPKDGLIPAGTTYVDRDGKTQTSTGVGKDLVSSLSNLESRNAGSLHVQGGIRSAAIGGGPMENSGYMTFNGGNITAEANDPVRNGSGCGIGGGHAGGSTTTVINGGNVDAIGSFHGAGIGGGCTYTGGMSSGIYTYPMRDALISRQSNHTIAGDITINGGFVKSKGWTHSNAFGQGCGGNNNGKTILITGGTLLPLAASTQEGGFMDIGGNGGYVIITGGSVNCRAGKFQGNANDGKAWGDLAMTKKVSMLTVNVGPKIKAMADSEGVEPDYNARLESWQLLLDKFPTDPVYGAPANLNEGKLYLWMPEGTNNTHQIDANFSYYVGEKLLSSKTTLPTGSSSDGTTPIIKEWVDFTLPQEFIEENWNKYYDGSPLPTVDLAAHPIPVRDPTDGMLNNNGTIKFNYQQISETGSAWGTAVTGTATPADAGLYEIEVRSTQYSSDSTFAVTYWGHNATGVATIKPVTSKVEVAEPVAPAQLSFTTADGKTETKEYSKPTWAQDDNAGNYNTATNNHLVVPVDVTSDVLPFGHTNADGSTMSNTACKAPTGTLQLHIDGRAVPASLGGVIKVTDDSLKDGKAETGQVVKDASGREHTVAYFNITRSQIERFGLASTEGNNHTVSVSYTSARSGAIARDAVAAQAETDGSEAADKGSQAGVGDVAPAYTDSSYVNYYESAAPASQVEIELAEPDFQLFNEKGTGYVPNGEGLEQSQVAANNAKLKLDEEHERDYKDAAGNVQGTRENTDVSQFRDEVDDNGNVTKTQQDWFPLYVVTNSIGDIEFTSSNPGVIAIEPNSYTTDRAYVENKTDYGIGAKAKVVSAGKTTITATIKGTGAYSGATKSFDIYVFPDLAKEPVLAIDQTSYNTSRDDGTIRPGDTLRTVVDVTNTTPDSACINPVVTVSVPKNTTFKRLVAVDPEGNETDITDQVRDKIRDGVVTVDTIGTIFGGQTCRLKMDVEIDPSIITAKDPKLTSESSAQGIYGVKDNDFDWDNRIPKDGLPVAKVDAKADPTGPAPKGPSGGDKPGTPGDEPGGDNPGGDNPGGNEDPDNPDNPGGDKPANPDDPTGPADPDDRDDHDLIVVPTDPDPKAGDITVAKSWTNVTAGADKRTNKEIVQVGDELSYTITVANTKPGAAYYGTTVADELPVGMEYVPGSIEIAHVGLSGTATYKKDDFKADYNTKSRKLYIAVGHLLGGEQATVTFRVRVTTERLNYNDPQSLVNVGRAFGTDPSDTVTDPEPDPNHPDDTPEGPKGRDIPDGTPGPYGDENPPTDPIDDERGKEEPTTQEISYTVKTEKKEAEGGDADALTAIQLLEKLRALVAADGYDLSAEPATSKLTDGAGKAIEKVSLVETGKGVYTATFTKDDGSTVRATLTHVVWDENSSDEDKKDEVSEYKASASVSEKVGEGAMTQAELVERALGMAKGRGLVIPAGMEPGQWKVFRMVDGKEEELGADEVVDRSQEAAYTLRADFSREATDEHGAMAGPLALTYSLFDTSQPQSDPGPGTSGPVAPSNPDASKVLVTKESTNTTPHEDGKVHVGDLLAYEIAVANNDAPSTCLYDLVISDELPQGIEVVSGSLEMELPGGATKEVPDSVYNPLTHSLSVYGGYLKGGETIKLRFKAKVAEGAEGKDIGNHAVASYVDPSDSSTGTIFGTEPRPKPGEPAKSGDFKGSKLLEPTRAAYPDGVTDPVAPAVSGTGLPDTGTLRPVPVSGLLRGLLPVTGDTGPVTGLVAAVAAALGATAWVLRRKREGEEDAS